MCLKDVRRAILSSHQFKPKKLIVSSIPARTTLAEFVGFRDRSTPNILIKYCQAHRTCRAVSIPPHTTSMAASANRSYNFLSARRGHHS